MKTLNYQDLKEFYENHKEEIRSLQISNGLLYKKNEEYRSIIKVLKKDIQELSYLLTEIMKEDRK